MMSGARHLNDSGGAKRPGPPRVLVAEPGAAFAALAAEAIAARIAEAIAARRECALMLSGGRTPGPVYEALGARGSAWGVDWSRVRFYFADERCVPPDHPESNYRMIMESLLGRIPAAPEQIERMKAEEPDHLRAAEEYDRKLPEKLDVLLLGMGEDGHTASLFPGSPALGEEARRVVAVESPKPPACRLTITPPVIGKARSLAVIVAGAVKAEIVARALEGPYDPNELPAQLALGAVWIIDREAAALLKGFERT